MQSDIIIIDSHKMCCTYCLTNVVCALSSVGDIKELRASLDEGQIQVVYKKTLLVRKLLHIWLTKLSTEYITTPPLKI